MDITFSIIKLDYNTVRDFTVSIYEIDKCKRTVLTKDNLDDINPNRGKKVFPKFSIWRTVVKDIAFFKSNYEDGLSNLTRHISRNLKCDVINISILESSPYPIFRFNYLRADGRERVVQLLKDSRWEFFTKGVPLHYENLEYYSKRSKKDRLNRTIIDEYLEHEIPNFYENFNTMKEGVLVEKATW